MSGGITLASKRRTHLLRTLRDEERQAEVVQAQRHIEQLVHVCQEDNVLDGVVHFFRM